ITSEPNPITRTLLGPYSKDIGSNLPDDIEFATTPMQLPMLENKPDNPTDGDIWINAERGRVELFFDGKTTIIAQRSTKLITPMPAMNEYVRFASFMILGIVAAFQLPVVMLVLGWTQIFDPRGIQSLRKYALFAAFALGAVLTPADPLSMLVLAIPLYLLFEFGLLLMKLTFNKREPDMPAGL
ncbi:MAG: twin-arginine translocase subunit TatC, partial [Phycisphaeraceae bacterium]